MPCLLSQTTEKKTSSESIDFLIFTFLANLGGLKLEFWPQVSPFFEREHLKLLEKHHFSPIWPSNSSKKNAFSYVKYKVLAFPQILKPFVLQCFKHFFHAKTQPNAAKPCFSTLEKSLNTRFGGHPRASRRPKKHDFQRF